METAKLKQFAQFARRSLIEQISAKLKRVLAEDSAARRESTHVINRLDDTIRQQGMEQVIERVAYIWFNRFCALRFMDVNRYTQIGVVSPAEAQSQPEILAEAKMGHIDDEMVSDKTRQQIFDLLDGKTPSHDPQAEAYRLLVVAACNHWHRPMPFLFERIADYTELLMPDDLLSANSILASTREAMTPDACQDVEVLGWLYQFYISERKDQVMARKSAVPTEDIPAVTQLFTPHWIVRYLVENSLGRLWLLNRPNSKLREHMPYYIEGEAETNFLKITKPEDIRVLDPAVGSGHMLTYAFDLLSLIYEEEGYAAAEIPALILRHNLHGLEICRRAAQLAELALVFKARKKSRRFFQPEHLVRPHIIELRDVRFKENELCDYIQELDLGELFNQPMLNLLHQFEEAKTFGSLIQPCLDERTIAFARRAIEAKDLGGQLFLHETHRKVLRVIDQAEALTRRYHVVVSNPPYQEQDDMNSQLRQYVEQNFSEASTDLCCAFILRNQAAAQSGGIVAMITMQSWMFLDGSVDLRERLFPTMGLLSMLHLGPRAFDAIPGEVVQTTAFVFDSLSNNGRPVFHRLVAGKNEEEKRRMLISGEYRFENRSLNDLREITGSPLAYWASDAAIKAFDSFPALASLAEPRQGLITGETSRFLRYWHEVNSGNLGLCLSDRAAAKASGKKWFPQDKGGPPRRWYGNNDFVVNWLDDGNEIRNFKTPGGRLKSRPQNLDYYFRSGVTWTKISSGAFAVRFTEAGFIFSDAGMKVFHSDHAELLKLEGFLNSRVADRLLACLSETINYEQGNIARLPVVSAEGIIEIVSPLIEIARADWDNFETSWDFRDQPLLRPGLKSVTLEASWQNWETQCTAAIRRMQELETENNRLFITAYGLDGELSPDVPEEQITLARADARRDMAAFLSYAVGCMMGRYSLDHPGLILANAGDTLSEYMAKVGRTQDQLTFVPDADGVIPILDGDWFPDDITERFKKFLKVTFGEAHFDENIRFIETALGKDIRKYFLTDFYKNHVQAYKKRPIYWLFSSPKGSFNALIYMHRYRPDTVSVVLNDYLREFRTKLASHKNHLEAVSISGNSTPSEKTKALKEIEKVKKTITEMEEYERDVLYPLATEQVEIDLDDGVKVNYVKFGTALKKIPGLETKEE